MQNTTSLKIVKNRSHLISLFLPSLAGGGAERVMINIGDYISRHEVRVDLMVASAMGEYRSDIPDKVRLIEFGPGKPIGVIPNLIQYFRREKPSALLTTITNANIAALIAAFISMVPIQCVVREASTLGIELKKSSRLNRFILPYFVRNLYNRASSIVAPSQGVAKDLSVICKLPLNKIHVIPNPIVSSSMLNKAKAQPEHHWFKNALQPIILGIGRLTVQKDFITLIKAFGLLRRHREAKLIIIGEGDQRPVLEKLIRNETLSHEVSMPGFIDNPYPYLSNASVFVLSSRWEGLPGVLIEGLACGAKVISTDCPSGPKEILDNGRYGQLVPVGDYKAMAKAIGRVLSGEYTAVDPHSQAAMFDLEKNAEAYMRLLLN